MKKVLTKEEFAEKLRKELKEKTKGIKPPREYKSAGVTAYRKFTHIFSRAVYGAAYPDPKGYKEYFSPTLTAQEIGREVRAALEASRFIPPDHPERDDVIRIPTTEEFKAREEANKARAGVKTQKALFNGAGHVSLRLQDGRIEIKPARYRARGHWEGIRGHKATVLPEDVPDEALGAAILEALEISRNA